ncbi:TetR/AcrR family transcriptional regulator [Bradyrhizobium sp. dw_411]|uniref:TetR/AcrR family transcriptional regulator n=1 Tax=Bradyrhizobium sp. dw_411 TaxID=2720082 RepID=UPI001BCC1865|nr:TetR/AcrR family transcriptional regulator [Bradyrhizobium sp. dw_411]
MRYSTDHKAQTRERILQAAAEAIRGQGIERVSVAGVMAAADLTIGGFYAHFKSKDDLVAEAITYSFDERYAGFLSKVNASDAQEALTAFIDYYLSIRHSQSAGRGCPIPALAAEVPHMSPEARARFSAGVARLVGGLTTLLERTDIADPQIQANSILAELVGALGLARSAQKPGHAKAVLVASQQALKQRLGLVAG